MHRNEVALAGRLSMEPAHRELPSGALLTRWRLAVRRPGGRPGRHRSDAIECATLDDGVRDMLVGWQLDDLVEVEGALRPPLVARPQPLRGRGACGTPRRTGRATKKAAQESAARR